MTLYNTIQNIYIYYIYILYTYYIYIYIQLYRDIGLISSYIPSYGYFTMALQVVRALCALDGSRVAAGSNDGFVRLWDASGKMLAERQVAQPPGGDGTGVTRGCRSVPWLVHSYIYIYIHKLYINIYIYIYIHLMGKNLYPCFPYLSNLYPM